MTDLNRRNTESVFQRLNDMDIMIRETRIMLDIMNSAIASLDNRVAQLETTINMLRIAKMGNGPTENE